jgi:hypothetical protein
MFRRTTDMGFASQPAGGSPVSAVSKVMISGAGDDSMARATPARTNGTEFMETSHATFELYYATDVT